MVSYGCSTPATGVFTSKTPANLNSFCDGTTILTPRIQTNCPQWTGIQTDILVRNYDTVIASQPVTTWHSGILLNLTVQTNEYEIYESDWQTETAPRTSLTYIPEDLTPPPIFGGWEQNYYYPVYTSFKWKIYSLCCYDYFGIGTQRFRTYIRVKDVVGYDGIDGNIDILREQFSYTSTSAGDVANYITCPNQRWLDGNPDGICRTFSLGTFRYA